VFKILGSEGVVGIGQPVEKGLKFAISIVFFCVLNKFLIVVNGVISGLSDDELQDFSVCGERVLIHSVFDALNNFFRNIFGVIVTEEVLIQNVFDSPKEISPFNILIFVSQLRKYLYNNLTGDLAARLVEYSEVAVQLNGIAVLNSLQHLGLIGSNEVRSVFIVEEYLETVLCNLINSCWNKSVISDVLQHLFFEESHI
jgi:hypothetical protein